MYGKSIKYSLLILASGLLTSACTDSRSATAAASGQNSNTQINKNATSTNISQLVQAAEVKVPNQNGDPTVAYQLQVRGTSLFVTGRPFMFTRWEISPNPENPIKTFAAADNIQTFTPMGAWTADYYASGGLEIAGPMAYMSGSFGLSLVNIGNISSPVEIARKPPLDPTKPGVIPSDDAYMYKAIIAHPTLPIYYGFRQQDYVYTVDTSTVALNLIRRDSYGSNGQNVCCVTSATRFGNRIYVAFRDRVVMFDMASDGKLVAAGSYNGLHAANVTSTPQYLYVQHEPISGVATTYPRGLYVFDTAGNNVDRITTGVNLLRMAVAWDDGHVYANTDNTSVKIYRIQWKVK